MPLAVMMSVFFQAAAWVLLTLNFPRGATPESGYIANQGNLALLLVLFVVFTVVGTTWSFLIARGRLPLASGAGFVLAGTGLFLRVVSEVGLTLDLIWVEDTTVSLLFLARGISLVVYVFGLALVVASCVSHIRIAGRTPSWTRFAS
jgi:hypothetical protein